VFLTVRGAPPNCANLAKALMPDDSSACCTAFAEVSAQQCLCCSAFGLHELCWTNVWTSLQVLSLFLRIEIVVHSCTRACIPFLLAGQQHQLKDDQELMINSVPLIYCNSLTHLA
jgi:hypothetical protein